MADNVFAFNPKRTEPPQGNTMHIDLADVFEKNHPDIPGAIQHLTTIAAAEKAKGHHDYAKVLVKTADTLQKRQRNNVVPLKKP